MMIDDSIQQKQRYNIDHWIWICICVCCVLFGSVIMILFVSFMPKFRYENNIESGSYVRIFTVSYTMENTNSDLTFNNLTLLAKQMEDIIGSVPRGNLYVIAADKDSTELQCDSNTGYMFVIRVYYPSQYKCRTSTCVQDFYSTIYHEIQSLETISLTSDNNVIVSMNFCSIEEISSGNHSNKTTYITSVTMTPTPTVEDTTSITSVITEQSSKENEESTTLIQLETSSETFSTSSISTEPSTVITESSTTEVTITQVEASSETISTSSISTESLIATTESSTTQVETASILPTSIETSSTTTETTVNQGEAKSETIPTTSISVTNRPETQSTTTSNSKPRYLYVLPKTVQGIWNTVAGGNSSNATALALGMGTYPSDRSPDNLFDDLNTTRYSSRGNSLLGSNAIAGLNTGFYVSVGPCPSVLQRFIIQTSNEDATRDPINITIEGSNKNSNLDVGSSWTLIYNGSAGLDNDPGRQTDGLYRTVYNTNAYKNYRLLVTAKRGSQSDFVSYGALRFYGHYIQFSTPISNSSFSLLNVIISSTQAIWNTTVGKDSKVAVSGSSGYGTYTSGNSPSNLFDNSTSTKYISRGNVSSGTNANAGINTGFYVTVADCQAVLTSFSFFAEASRSDRDPTSVTIEGSNSDDLTKGTSWYLLYSGPTGLRTTNRASEGDRQSVNNSNSYLSYRFLITGRRSTSSDYVSYSEVKLYGYHA